MKDAGRGSDDEPSSSQRRRSVGMEPFHSTSSRAIKEVPTLRPLAAGVEGSAYAVLRIAAPPTHLRDARIQV